jgi:hydrogenase 3 maturation protease
VNHPTTVPEDFETTMRHRLIGRVAVMGIGNTLRGDDGFGVRLMEGLLPLNLPAGVRLFLCETTPENFVGPVVHFQPDTILMVDAAELGGEPGSARLVDLKDIAGIGMTTHTLSLRLLGNMLESTTDAAVMLLAVQPQSRAFGTGLSDEVQHTLRYLTNVLARVLRDMP